MGDWNDATGQHFECPFCKANLDALERRGNEWHCTCCSRCWFAYTEHDKLELKVNRIKDDEQA